MEHGFLIERSINGYAEWLCIDEELCFQWSIDANEAIRFARKIDGEKIMNKFILIGCLGYDDSISVTGHTWMDI